jgi:hypothetical protein
MSHHSWFNMIGFHVLVLFFPVAMAVLWRRPNLWPHLLMIFLGMITGLLSVRTDDMGFPVLLLLVFAFFGGFVQPGRAWLCACLVAMWIPVTEAAAHAAGVTQGSPFGILNSLFAFIPAFAGAYLGVFIRHVSKTGQVASKEG